MSQEAIDLAKDLKKYVDELIDAQSRNHERAIKGRTEMIKIVWSKLRKLHEDTSLTEDLISQITEDKKRAGIDLPDSYSEYQSICWYCYAKYKKKVTVDKRVHPVCTTCGWVKCPVCGACRDQKFGGCPDFFEPIDIIDLSEFSKPHENEADECPF